MDKKEMIDALEAFSQNVLNVAAEVEAVKKYIQTVIDENTALRLENSKLRERLKQEDKEEHKPSTFGLESLEKIYEDGFHVCHDSYGQRREQDEPCMFCLGMFHRG